jgi:hypothetical protein
MRRECKSRRRYGLDSSKAGRRQLATGAEGNIPSAFFTSLLLEGGVILELVWGGFVVMAEAAIVVVK